MKVKLSLLALVVSSALLPSISNAALSSDETHDLNVCMFSKVSASVEELVLKQPDWASAVQMLHDYNYDVTGLNPNEDKPLPPAVNPPSQQSGSVGGVAASQSPVGNGSTTTQQSTVDDNQNTAINAHTQAIKTIDQSEKFNGSQIAGIHRDLSNLTDQEKADATANAQTHKAQAAAIETAQAKAHALSERLAIEEIKRADAAHLAQLQQEHQQIQIAEAGRAAAGKASSSAAKHAHVELVQAVQQTTQAIQQGNASTLATANAYTDTKTSNIVTVAPVNQKTADDAAQAAAAAQALISGNSNNGAPAPSAAPSAGGTVGGVAASAAPSITPATPALVATKTVTASKKFETKPRHSTVTTPETETVKGQYSVHKDVSKAIFPTSNPLKTNPKGIEIPDSTYTHASSAKRAGVEAVKEYQKANAPKAATPDDVKEAVNQENQYVNNRFSDLEKEAAAGVRGEAAARVDDEHYIQQESKRYTDQKFKQVQSQQNKDRAEYRGGIAAVGAISGLHYTDTSNSIAIGGADFKNSQGYALGYRHQWNDYNAATTASVAGSSNGDAVIAVSAAIGW